MNIKQGSRGKRKFEFPMPAAMPLILKCNISVCFQHDGGLARFTQVA
jgi:hypothetical protein